MSRSTVTVSLLGAAATLMLAAACGTSTTTTTTSASSSAPGSATPAAPGGVLGVATTSLGPVLVDGKGLTVYMLTSDSPGHSACSAACLAYWPPVTGPAPASVKGITAPLSVTKATSGTSMVTAAGWPLYTFVKDSAPGDVTGEGVKSFGGTWYAVSPSGKAVTAAPAKTAPTTTSSSGSSGGGGYGY
jgi:predicted lipoprotein with Yx(FWY)xxD motif